MNDVDAAHMCKGHIRIRCEDKVCFWIDPETLEPQGVSVYDTWCFSDPLPCRHMSYAEWTQKRTERMFPL